MLLHHAFNKVFIAVITALWTTSTIAAYTPPEKNRIKSINAAGSVNDNKRIDFVLDEITNIGQDVIFIEKEDADISIKNNSTIYLTDVLFSADYSGSLSLVNNGEVYSEGGLFLFTPQKNASLHMENNGTLVMNSLFSASLGEASSFSLINRGKMLTTDNDLILLHSARGGDLNISNSGTMHSDNYGVLHFYPISANKINVSNTGEISGARKTLFFPRRIVMLTSSTPGLFQQQMPVILLSV
ncbi:hypothetical protein [Kosakonia radicincitans]|uniref:hypothetical protein n=1 Tax=Kosakonia radicincitans TaxID=283686 RepID=UPI0005C2FCF1|nr:hypothetical protein [Kosakonia radicincitans]KIS43199.1 hypothetical protein LG58_3629 [Kosakonia radicincitans YD4]